MEAEYKWKSIGWVGCTLIVMGAMVLMGRGCYEDTQRRREHEVVMVRMGYIPVTQTESKVATPDWQRVASDTATARGAK